MRSGQIRESCSGCNNAGCRSFSCGGRPKAESAQGSLEKKAALAAVRSVLQLSGQDGSTRWRSLQLTALAAVRFSVRIGLCLFGKKGNARWRSLLRLRLCLKPCPNLRFGAQASCESSPASAGSELTAPFSERITSGSWDRKATFAVFAAVQQGRMASVGYWWIHAACGGRPHAGGGG